MKKIKLFPIILLLIILVIATISIVWTKFNISDNSQKNTDYTPEEEITSEDLSKTTVTLYFIESGSNSLKSEGKLVDSKTLLENPYKKIVELLISGPTSENLQKVFPENTKILNATIDNNCVTLNFSEELLNFKDDTQKYNIINSILNSLAELTEVSSIKFQVNGKATDSMNEEYSKIY